MARLWQVQVGRVKLILLDTNVAENPRELQDLTDELYGGDQENRIRQEILLGIGGLRALRHLKIEPSVYHMNEGHTAFLTLELVLERVAAGEPLDSALKAVARNAVFTTHTPVAAGHDRFAPDLVERHLGWLRRELGMDEKTFVGLGRVRLLVVRGEEPIINCVSHGLQSRVADPLPVLACHVVPGVPDDVVHGKLVP